MERLCLGCSEFHIGFVKCEICSCTYCRFRCVSFYLSTKDASIDYLHFNAICKSCVQASEDLVGR